MAFYNEDSNQHSDGSDSVGTFRPKRLKRKEAFKALDNGTLFWADPDPIEGNDYKVTTLVWAKPISIIQYNEGMSEAEIFNHELVITTNL